MSGLGHVSLVSQSVPMLVMLYCLGYCLSQTLLYATIGPCCLLLCNIVRYCYVVMSRHLFLDVNYRDGILLDVRRMQAVSLLSMPSRHALVGSRSEPPISLAPSMVVSRPLLPPPAPPYPAYADEEVAVHDDAEATLKVEVEEASTVKKEEVGLAYIAAIKLEDAKPKFRADPFHLQRVGGHPRSPSASPPPRRSIGDIVKGRPRTPVNYRLARPYHRR